MTTATAAAPAAATRITFETESCSRCGGSGTMPFNVWGGKCFKCAGSGRSLTKAGRAASARRQRFLDGLPKTPVAELKAGDRIPTIGSEWGTVVEPLDFDASPAAWSGAERTPLFGLLVKERGGRLVNHCVAADDARLVHPGFAAIVAALTKRDGSPYAGVIFS